MSNILIYIQQKVVKKLSEIDNYFVHIIYKYVCRRTKDTAPPKMVENLFFLCFKGICVRVRSGAGSFSFCRLVNRNIVFRCYFGGLAIKSNPLTKNGENLFFLCFPGFAPMFVTMPGNFLFCWSTNLIWLASVPLRDTCKKSRCLICNGFLHTHFKFMLQRKVHKI